MDPTILAHPTPPAPDPPRPQMPPTPPPAPASKRSKWFYIGLAGIIVGVVCCLLGVVALLVSMSLNNKAAPAVTRAPVNLPPATSIPMPTLPPVFDTPAPLATVASPLVTSFQDDFSSANSGWLLQSSDNTESSYNSSGFFEMSVKKADYYLVATSPDSLTRPLKNLLIKVLVQPGQTNTGDYGVVCRYQDIDNFYMAGITGDQFYIGKQVKGEWTFLTAPNYQALPDRTTDANGYKSIGLSCIDSFIVMEINGIGAAHVTDSEFDSGDAGLAVWAGTSPDANGYYARAGFDDFSLELK